MKYDDIIKLHTDSVKGLIDKGYVINPKLMGGSQSRIISHVALSKDDNTIVCYIKGWYDTKDYFDGLSVGMESFSFGLADTPSTVFFNSGVGTIISEVALYKVSGLTFDIASGWYTDFDDAKKIRDKQFTRHTNRNSEYRTYRSDSAKAVATKIIHRVTGFKRIKPEHIECIQDITKGSLVEWRVFVWKNWGKQNASRKCILITNDSLFGRHYLTVEQI